jgi:hypothetical protein
MPFRLVVRPITGGCVVEIHGWLVKPEVGTFEEACASQGQPVSIDLERLLGVDAEGLLALHRQRALGAQLFGASPYIALLMARSAEAGGTGGSGGN